MISKKTNGQKTYLQKRLYKQLIKQDEFFCKNKIEFSPESGSHEKYLHLLFFYDIHSLSKEFFNLTNNFKNSYGYLLLLRTILERILKFTLLKTDADELKKYMYFNEKKEYDHIQKIINIKKRKDEKDIDLLRARKRSANFNDQTYADLGKVVSRIKELNKRGKKTLISGEQAEKFHTYMYQYISMYEHGSLRILEEILSKSDSVIRMSFEARQIDYNAVDFVFRTNETMFNQVKGKNIL